MISVIDAASRLGISVPRVHQLIRAGRLTGQKIAGVWLLDECSVAAYKPKPNGRPRKKT